MSGVRVFIQIFMRMILLICFTILPTIMKGVNARDEDRLYILRVVEDDECKNLLHGARMQNTCAEALIRFKRLQDYETKTCGYAREAECRVFHDDPECSFMCSTISGAERRAGGIREFTEKPLREIALEIRKSTKIRLLHNFPRLQHTLQVRKDLDQRITDKLQDLRMRNRLTLYNQDYLERTGRLPQHHYLRHSLVQMDQHLQQDQQQQQNVRNTLLDIEHQLQTHLQQLQELQEPQEPQELQQPQQNEQPEGSRRRKHRN